MIDELYAGASSIEHFIGWTKQTLEPHGFTEANTLPLVGVCRDELMFPIEQAVHDAWGLSFDMSSLGAMLFLGRSGMAAAAHHAPGEDGRHRYLCIVLPHVGIDRARGVGYVSRQGQAEPTSACGALMGLRDEMAIGRRDLVLDPDDLEMSLLRMVVLPRVGEAVPALDELTEIARQAATDDLRRLVAGLLESSTADVAVISGLMIHGPGGDRVAVRQAWVAIGSSEPIELV